MPTNSMRRFAMRLGAWRKRSFRHKLRSIAQHLKIDRVLTIVCSASARLDNPIFRIARFDSMKADRDFALAVRDQDYFVVIPRDRVISRTLFVDGIFDFEKLERALGLIGRDFKLETLIDIGANIGTICIPAVKRGLAKRAIAIEPEPKNFRALVANVYLNNLAERITIRNLALGPEENQTLKMELSPDNSGDHRIQLTHDNGNYSEGTRATIDVPSKTLDSVIPEINPASHLIWMDTQGFEGLILQGAKNALRARVPMVIEFWPYGMRRTNSFSLLKEAMLNYRQCYDLSSDSSSPIELSGAYIDGLYERLAGHSDYTDLLLI